ncbi:hypothetical protein HK102_005169, partial [Quaeritorhiza haematococci]
MTWSHSDTWMVTADDLGVIKYWQSNMNNLKAFQGHKDVIRDLTFSPTDSKFASCSDDGTIKIWNFLDGSEERVLTGHGWDVKCIDWHPSKGLLASGSKDNLVKLWDPKTGKALTTLHGHKNTILGIQWNRNGNWLVTAARDQLLRVYDIRTMRELQTFRGHKKEVTAVAWHPFHESLFASGGADGSISFWLVGTENSVGGMEVAHDSAVWSLDWHPMGHILVSGSNDYTTRFWTRSRPGEVMAPAGTGEPGMMGARGGERMFDGTRMGGDFRDMSMDADEEDEDQLPGLGDFSFGGISGTGTGGIVGLGSSSSPGARAGSSTSGIPGMSSSSSRFPSGGGGDLPGLGGGGFDRGDGGPGIGRGSPGRGAGGKRQRMDDGYYNDRRENFY